MKKTFNVVVKQASGMVVQKGILAQDSEAHPAIVEAIGAAIANSGSGSEVIGVTFGSSVDIDATA
jgi:hypothetical protein